MQRRRNSAFSVLCFSSSPRPFFHGMCLSSYMLTFSTFWERGLFPVEFKFRFTGSLRNSVTGGKLWSFGSFPCEDCTGPGARLSWEIQINHWNCSPPTPIIRHRWSLLGTGLFPFWSFADSLRVCLPKKCCQSVSGTFF